MSGHSMLEIGAQANQDKLTMGVGSLEQAPIEPIVESTPDNKGNDVSD